MSYVLSKPLKTKDIQYLIYNNKSVLYIMTNLKKRKGEVGRNE